MTGTTPQRDPDAILAAWLEEGPDRLPESTRRAIVVATRTTSQTRRALVGLPWRTNPMISFPRLAFALVALVVAVGGAIYFLSPGTQTVGGLSPAITPLPSTPAASAAPSAESTLAPSASPAPATRPPNIGTPAPYFPASPLPDPAGNGLPADLIERTYEANPPEVQGTQQLILTLRAADDPHCAAMFEGRSTCFTYLWTPNYPKHTDDPAARGSARIVDGRLVLSFDLVPSDLPCVGQKATYTIEDAGATLTGMDPPACTVPGFTAVTIPPD